MKLKDKLKAWLDSFPIKDEDMEETEEEKAARLAAEEEAKKAEEEAKKAEEEAKQAEEAKKKEAQDKKTKDDVEGRIAALESAIGEIKAMIAELLSIEEDEETHDSDEDDEEKKRLEEEEKKAQEAKDAAEAEEEEAKKKEEEEKEKQETADCESVWPDLVSRAEVLSPSYKPRKPTKDHRRTMDSIKKEVLLRALKEEAKDEVSKVLAGKDLRKMTSDALDVAFVAASEVVAAKRNGRLCTGKVKMHDFASARSVAEINKANKEFYGKK